MSEEKQDKTEPRGDSSRVPCSNLLYLLLAKKHTTKDGIALWWRPEQKGYTTDWKAAGRYDMATAKNIQKDTHGDNVAIPLLIVESLSHRITTEMTSDNIKKMRRYLEI